MINKYSFTKLEINILNTHPLVIIKRTNNQIFLKNKKSDFLVAKPHQQNKQSEFIALLKCFIKYKMHVKNWESIGLPQTNIFLYRVCLYETARKFGITIYETKYAEISNEYKWMSQKYYWKYPLKVRLALEKNWDKAMLLADYIYEIANRFDDNQDYSIINDEN